MLRVLRLASRSASTATAIRSSVTCILARSDLKRCYATTEENKQKRSPSEETDLNTILQKLDTESFKRNKEFQDDIGRVQQQIMELTNKQIETESKLRPVNVINIALVAMVIVLLLLRYRDAKEQLVLEELLELTDTNLGTEILRLKKDREQLRKQLLKQFAATKQEKLQTVQTLSALRSDRRRSSQQQQQDNADLEAALKAIELLDVLTQRVEELWAAHRESDKQSAYKLDTVKAMFGHVPGQTYQPSMKEVVEQTHANIDLQRQQIAGEPSASASPASSATSTTAAPAESQKKKMESLV